MSDASPWPRRLPAQRFTGSTSSYLCPNCDQRFSPHSRGCLYCSRRCSSEAEAVRYARKKLLEYPHGMPDDIGYAIEIQMAHALSGGYDRAARRLSPDTRAAVRKRDGYRCALCADGGEDIDHIAGPSAAMASLRLLCKRCHREVTMQRLGPVTDEVTGRRWIELQQRIRSKEPLRPCDTPNWATRWRAWRSQHAAND